MLRKLAELVKGVRTEMSEVIVAGKEGDDVRVQACLEHAKGLIGIFLRKEYGYG